MVCSKCGTEINTGLKFCTKCGSKINIPGKLFLMVTGIIFIVFALYGIYSERGLFGDIRYMRNMDVNIFQYPGFIRFIILFFIGIILSIIIGVFGIKYCKNIEKAKLLMCCAIIVLVFNIASFIIIRGLLWTSIIGFILPICFLIGAIMNLKIKGGK
jgi:hypothetical protein